MVKKTNDIVTKEYLDKTLDKRLAQHSQVIISAVGEIMDKKLVNVTKEISSLQTSLENTKEELLVNVTKEISSLQTSLENTKEELKIDINNIQTLIDGYVQAQEDFKQEFVIMKEEVQKIKEFIKKKFKVEIKAI